MRAELYNNPLFATGLSNMLGGFLGGGNPKDIALAELAAAQAGNENDTREYRRNIGTAGKDDLAGMLVSSLQAGNDYSNNAPVIASSLASLPGSGFTPQQQGDIQVGTGTQRMQDTSGGLAAVLGNNLAQIRTKGAVDRQNDAAGYEAFRSALGGGLINSESGGNFGARNSEVGAGGHVGHFGRAQFGVARLEDAKRAGVIPASVSPDVFLANPDMQARVEQWHRGDILADAQRNGTYSLIGSTVAGIPVTEQGLINVAHLGGKEGARKFFESGGAYNPADANGTKLSDYLAKGAEEAMGTGYGGGGAAPGGDLASMLDPRMMELMLAAGNPAMTSGQSDIVLKLAEQFGPQKPGAGFTLSSGQRRYDAQGNEIAAAPEDPASVKGLSAGGRSTLIGMLEGVDPRKDDISPEILASIVAQVDEAVRGGTTENEAINHALSNLQRSADVTKESWLPFGWGDTTEPGAISGVNFGVGNPEAAGALDEARAAIAEGADRVKVMQRLQSMGIDPAGL